MSAAAECQLRESSSPSDSWSLVSLSDAESTQRRERERRPRKQKKKEENSENSSHDSGRFGSLSPPSPMLMLVLSQQKRKADGRTDGRTHSECFMSRSERAERAHSSALSPSLPLLIRD